MIAQILNNKDYNELVISSNRSRVKVLRIHTKEDLQIAKETLRLIS
jgi:acetate kinase